MKANTKSGKLTGLSERSSDMVLVVLCSIFLFLVAYPLYYILIASVSNPYDVYAGKTFLLPSQFTLEGYKAVFADISILTGLLNSLKYTIIGTIFSVVVLYLAAYPLSVKNLPGRKWISIFFIITMYFGGGMIPTYLTIKNMGMTGTIWSILLPGCISVYNLIILRTGFEGIPESLVESAEMDGAGDLTILWKIILPLSKASLATITLFYAVGRWGEWYNAMVYLESNRSLYPLQMILRETLVEGQNLDVAVDVMGVSTADSILVKEISKYSMVIISTVPVLIVYPFVQKYFVKGVMIGAVKG